MIDWLDVKSIDNSGLKEQGETQITYLHHDNLGSPIAATDQNGTVISREVFGPFGQKMLNQEANAEARVGYTGKHHNADTGLSYMNARYYHAELGRFDRMDPVGSLSGGIDYLNRYAYVINNSYKYVDPTGMTVDATKPDRLPDMRVEGDRSFYERDDYGGDGAGMGAGIGSMNGSFDVDASTIGVPVYANFLFKKLLEGLLKKQAKKAKPKQATLPDEAAKELTKQQQKGIRSLEKRIVEHEKKLQKFKDNPTVRPGMENLPKDTIRKQQQRRVKHLEKEINTFKNNIEKIKRGELDSWFSKVQMVGL